MNPDDQPAQAPRKLKFKPKAQPRKLRPTVTPKKEADENGAAGGAILQRFNELQARRGQRHEVADDSSFAVGPSEPPSSSKLHGNHTRNSGSSHASSSKVSKLGSKQEALSLPSPDVSTNDMDATMIEYVEPKKKKKEYVEPWDCDSHYPTTLPLRRPNSGRPEILNKLEFGDTQSLMPDESSEIHVAELGLLVENDSPEMFLVQIPHILPISRQQLYAPKRPATDGSSTSVASVGMSSKGKEIARGSPLLGRVSSPSAGNTERTPLPQSAKKPEATDYSTNFFERFPGGHMGKMLVYKSGKVKWKIGETLFDVASGVLSGNMAQDVVAMNTKEKVCCELAKLEKKMTIAPDMDSILDSLLE